MAISFPSNPTLNQTYTYNSVIWTYNGKGWTKSPTTVSALPNQTNNSGKYLTTNGSAATWGSLTVTPTSVSDQDNSSTGYFDLPAGTTAERPVSPATGYTRINTTNNSLEVYSAGTWNTVQSFGFISASGGTVTTQGDYKIHTFSSSSMFVLTSAPANATVDYLMVAGGGGGGSDMGGGGGGGGVLVGTNAVLTAGTYAITVGAGGAGALAGTNMAAGTSGSNSVIYIPGGTALSTAIGGGGGASDHDAAGSPALIGGSGGGASGQNANRALGTSGQGNPGANSAGAWYPGGGGGAGAAGATNPANGGVGIQNAILGTNYYWGGGGGGAGYTVYGGNGGQGGGGGGAPASATQGLAGTGGLNTGTAGTAGGLNTSANVPGGNGGTNTGGGGGGGSHYNVNNNGGTGGSGIVIIKYRYQ